MNCSVVKPPEKELHRKSCKAKSSLKHLTIYIDEVMMYIVSYFFLYNIYNEVKMHKESKVNCLSILKSK